MASKIISLDGSFPLRLYFVLVLDVVDTRVELSLTSESRSSSIVVSWEFVVLSLFRKKRFALNEMFQRNASKFAIFYV